MISKSLIQKNSSKVSTMSENTLRNLLSERDLYNKKVVKKFDFMGVPVNLTKLTISEVESLQELNKRAEEESFNEMDIMFAIIKKGCPDFAELEDEEIKNFPMDELIKLSSAVSKHSGLDQGKK